MMHLDAKEMLKSNDGQFVRAVLGGPNHRNTLSHISGSSH